MAAGAPEFSKPVPRKTAIRRLIISIIIFISFMAYLLSIGDCEMKEYKCGNSRSPMGREV